MDAGNKNKLTPLIGYDNRCLVYDAGEFILRSIVKDYFEEVTRIYDDYKRFNLNQHGIVETELEESEKALRHKKYIISYPYEWTANMFKDAVIFHLNLFIELEKYGLTLKDAVPNNIVFDFCRPIFIDFPSITFKEQLKSEKWLVNFSHDQDYEYAIVGKMLIPFMFIPFFALANNDYSLARYMLSERTCNCIDGPLSWRELYFKPNIAKVDIYENILKNIIKLLLRWKSTFDIIRKKNEIIARLNDYKTNPDFIFLVKQLLEIIKGINVTPTKSGYVSYYEEKGEKHDVLNQTGWKNKQINVFKLIKELKPKRVLDIGANTGWFSILAEKMGAEVIATDIDESSIDCLYLYSKANKLNILSLLLSFDDLEKEVYGENRKDEVYNGRDFESNPLFLAPTKRLQSNMVFCLGLLHHLVLGLGKDLKDIFETLSKLCKDVLVLEYVGLGDDKIVAEPSFFGNLHRYSKENYNINVIINVGKKYFANVEIMDSHPETRKLLLFKK